MTENPEYIAESVKKMIADTQIEADHFYGLAVIDRKLSIDKSRIPTYPDTWIRILSVQNLYGEWKKAELAEICSIIQMLLRERKISCIP